MAGKRKRGISACFDEPQIDNRNKKRLTVGGEICGICSGIDFLGFFMSNSSTRRVPISNLSEARRNQDCRFCRLVVRALLPGSLIEANAIETNVRCFLRSVSLEPDEHLLKHGLEVYRRLAVEGEAKSKGEIQFQSLAKLDLLGEPPAAKSTNGAQRSVMVRHVVKPLHDPRVLRSWLRACEINHTYPNGSQDSISEEASDAFQMLIATGRFRVIDVRKKVVVSLQKPERFLALSYVWGHVRQPTTSASRSLDWDRMPQTIKDAITLTEEMGEKHLWVDALCIDLNDPKDYRVNITGMTTIYENATLTIVAASGQDSDAGLPGAEQRPRSAGLSSTFASKGTPITLLSSPSSLTAHVKKSAWAYRAWTYQEHMLSHRCMYFTNDEVFLSCGHAIFRESYILPGDSSQSRQYERKSRQRPSSTHDRLREQIPLDSRDYWKTVSGYSGRSLTRVGDRLDAFCGLLPKFTHSTNLELENCLQHGIPIAFLEQTLGWKPATTGNSRRITYSADGRRRIPNWSWTGWTGPVLLDRPLGEHERIFTFSALDKYNVIGIPRKPSSYGDVTVRMVMQRIWKPPAVDLAKLSAPVQCHISPCASLNLWTISFRWQITNVRRNSLYLHDASATVPGRPLREQQSDLPAADKERGKWHECVVVSGFRSAACTVMFITPQGEYIEPTVERIGIAKIHVTELRQAIDAPHSQATWKQVRLQ